MFLMAVALALPWCVCDVSGTEMGKAMNPARCGEWGQEEAGPGVLVRRDDGACGMAKGVDTGVPVETQTEIKTVVKEIVVEVDGPREEVAMIAPMPQHQARAKVRMNSNPTTGDTGGIFGKEKCYVLIKDVHDGNVSKMVSLAESVGGRVGRQYTRNTTGVSFCSDRDDILRKISDGGIRIEEDKVYGVSAFQNNIPNYMYLMKHYGNAIFNNYLYDNWAFRVLQIKRLITSFLGLYEYHYTGKGVDILLLDTTAGSMHGNVCNLSGRTSACNVHGSVMADLLVGKTNGFAKDSRLNVLDVVGCDGKVLLSEIVHGLESLGEGRDPRILVFGVSGPYSETLNSVVDRISSHGVIVVSPAGNLHDQSCRYSPGSSKSTINVGSVDKHAGVSEFSNHGDCVRIFAPGEDVLGESNAAGTSLSAAIVASSIALFLERSPRATFADVWRYLNRNSFWNSRGSYSVLKIPRLDCGDYAQQSILHFGRIQEDFVTLAFVAIVVLVLAYLVLIVVRYIRRRRSRYEDDVLFDPPTDRF